MMDERAGRQIMARIGFAERWLHRAKRQVAEGNVTRGALTLVLANAEVRHALEAAGTGADRRRRVSAVVPPMLLVLAAATAIVMTQLPTTPAGTSDGTPVVVRLASRVGALLELVPAPVPVPAATVTAPEAVPIKAAAPMRRAVSSLKRLEAPPVITPSTPVVAAPRPVAPAAPPATTAAAPVVAAPVVAAPAVTQPAPAVTFELSPGDLIDLVLVAERALRSEPVRR